MHIIGTLKLPTNRALAVCTICGRYCAQARRVERRPLKEAQRRRIVTERCSWPPPAMVVVRREGYSSSGSREVALGKARRRPMVTKVEKRKCRKTTKARTMESEYSGERMSGAARVAEGGRTEAGSKELPSSEEVSRLEGRSEALLDVRLRWGEGLPLLDRGEALVRAKKRERKREEARVTGLKRVRPVIGSVGSTPMVGSSVPVGWSSTFTGTARTYFLLRGK